MQSKLVKLNQLSGSKASIYSVWLDDIQLTSFDNFLLENKNEFKSELKDILERLTTIGKKTGAKEYFFKINEGTLGDGVCALYDNPDKKLRLYCIRYGTMIVILGGGGEKTVQKLQQNKKLKDENYFLRKISKQITERLQDGELKFTPNGMDFSGNVEFNDEDDE